VGGAAALIAFILGMAVVQPAMIRSMRLGESLAAASAEERAKGMAEMQRLRERGVVGAGRGVLAAVRAWGDGGGAVSVGVRRDRESWTTQAPPGRRAFRLDVPDDAR
jgi:hypothetical protein